MEHLVIDDGLVAANGERRGHPVLVDALVAAEDVDGVAQCACAARQVVEDSEGARFVELGEAEPEVVVARRGDGSDHELDALLGPHARVRIA